MTALMAAASEGNDDVVELLVARGGTEELDRVDASGNTALLHAARAGNVSTMRTLISHGASVDVQNKLGETIWHYAIRRDDGDEFLRAVAALYRRSKRFDRRRLMKFADGRSPLQVCRVQGSGLYHDGHKPRCPQNHGHNGHINENVKN